MAIGTTDVWQSSRDEIISDALTNVGAIGPGDDADGQIRDHAARALNRLVKALDAEGTFLWRVSALTVATVSGTAAYALSALVFACEDPMTYMPAGSTTGTKIWPMSREEYANLADTTVAGTPTRFYIGRSLAATGRLLLTANFYPVPNVTADTIHYAGATRAKDYDDGSTYSDFPSMWTRCLVYGLTAELAPAYSQPEMALQYWQMFEAEKSKQLMADNENMGLTLVPWGNSSGY
jgi:hypothetical protein